MFKISFIYHCYQPPWHATAPLTVQNDSQPPKPLATHNHKTPKPWTKCGFWWNPTWKTNFAIFISVENVTAAGIHKGSWMLIADFWARVEELWHHIWRLWALTEVFVLFWVECITFNIQCCCRGLASSLSCLAFFKSLLTIPTGRVRMLKAYFGGCHVGFLILFEVNKKMSKGKLPPPAPPKTPKS